MACIKMGRFYALSILEKVTSLLNTSHWILLWSILQYCHGDTVLGFVFFICLLHVYAPPVVKHLPSVSPSVALSWKWTEDVISRRKKVACLQFDNGSLRGSLIIHASLNVFCYHFASSFEGDKEDGRMCGHQFLWRLCRTPTFRPQSNFVDSAQSRDLFERTCGSFGGKAKWADDKWSFSKALVLLQRIQGYTAECFHYERYFISDNTPWFHWMCD